jgi:hypothetical protein
LELWNIDKGAPRGLFDLYLAGKGITLKLLDFEERSEETERHG